MWIRIHLYLGLSLGSLFALLGLSGSMNVYAPELDRWANPSLYASEIKPRTSLAPAPLIQAAVQQAPGAWSLAFIKVQSASPSTMIVGFKTPDGELREIYLEASTGRLLGSRRDDESLAHLLLIFHDSFFIEGAAPQLAGVLGILLLLSIASGAYIWWPGHRRAVAALKVHRTGSRRRFYYELHRSVGAIAAGLLVVSCVTGIYQAFPEPFVSALGTGEEPSPQLASSAGRMVDLAAAAGVAKLEFPGAILRRADLLGPYGAEIRVILHDPRQPAWRGGETRLWINAATGTITRRRDPARQEIGPKILAWAPSVHTGEVAGEVGRLIMFVAGWMPAVLLFTGFRLWQIRRRARRAAPARPPI